MTVPMSSLLSLIQNGVGSKQIKITYAATYNALDAVIHSTLSKHNALILPHNTAGVSRGPVEKIHEVFVEAKLKASATSDYKRLGKFDRTKICAGFALPDLFSSKNKRIELSLCHLYVQSSFGKRKPYKDAPYHVDLEKFESGLTDLVAELEKENGSKLNLAMMYFGNESEYSTPWLDIESAINRVLDLTEHKMTVYVPSFLARTELKDLNAVRVSAYSKNRIEQAT